MGSDFHNGLALLVSAVCRLVPATAMPDLLTLVLGRLAMRWMVGLLQRVLL